MPSSSFCSFCGLPGLAVHPPSLETMGVANAERLNPDSSGQLYHHLALVNLC